MLSSQLTPADSSSLSDYSSEPALYFWSSQLYSSISPAGPVQAPRAQKTFTSELNGLQPDSNPTDLEDFYLFILFFLLIWGFHVTLLINYQSRSTFPFQKQLDCVWPVKNRSPLTCPLTWLLTKTYLFITFSGVCNPLQVSRWSCFLIVSFLRTGSHQCPLADQCHSDTAGNASFGCVGHLGFMRTAARL